MGKEKRQTSLRNYISGIFILMGIVILVVMISNNVLSIKIMERQIKESNQIMLETYLNQIEMTFEDVESWMVSQSAVMSEFLKIERPKTQLERMLSIVEVEKNFTTAIYSYQCLDGLFFYYPQEQIFFQSVKKGITAGQQRGLKKYIEGNVEKNENIYHKWIMTEVDGEFLLMQLMQIDKVIIGAFSNAETITGNLKLQSEGQLKEIILLNSDNAPQIQMSQEQKKELLEGIEEQRDKIQLEQEDYMPIIASNEDGTIKLCGLLAYSEIFKTLNYMQYIFYGIYIVLAVVTLLVIMLISRNLSRPMRQLIGAMQKLRKGDFSVRIEGEQYQEFKEVALTFEEMTKDIERLKLDVYNEIIDKQKINLQYLQQQIKPHFYINCLNIIQALNRRNQTEELNKLIYVLSDYLRYSLTDATMVLLEKEIEHVDNYMYLQILRYSEEISYIREIQDEAMQAMIPTMLIQTFVENAVKHAYIPGESLTIKVTGKLEEDNRILLRIEDSGEGFTEEVSERLNRMEELSAHGKRIGIYNCLQRLKIIYKEDFEAEFFNKEEGGACVEIRLPSEGEEKNERVVSGR